jgi:hypothetical protein
MSAMMSVQDLSDDLLVAVLSALPAAELRVAAATSNRWRECVPQAAELRFRLHGLGLPVGCDASPCWLRSLFTVELLEAAVGPRPAHSWREDYIDLHYRATEKNWRKDTTQSPWEEVAETMRQQLEPGGICSLDMDCSMSANLIMDRQAAGWSEDAAQLLLHTAGEEESQVLVECYLAGCSDFAATMHSLVTECCSYLMRGPPLAPECYCTVRALSDFESEWAALPTRRVGESFFCVGGASAREPLSCYFPDERGMRFEKSVQCPGTGNGENIRDWMTTYELDDSPVVRFLSSAADRNGFHSLMQDQFNRWESDLGPRGEYEHAGWSAPMFCTATLVEKLAPGEWEVRPYRSVLKRGLRPARCALRPQQPLYTVRLSFG